EPGFYGRIDIGDYPQPQMIYSKPVIIERGPVERAPIYLNVPPGYSSHWDKHCHEYNACGERVYFVKNDWYQHQYVPRYQAHHRDERHDDHRDDHRDEHRDDHDHRNDRDHDHK
ncbi:MAG TPA: hypothetical protein VLC91_17230, partial [Spongiibacteraceae bacterium]|nr:hypothetical protein [Spongiibacteraceae bacterium]